MFQFRRVATHIGSVGAVPHVLADVVHHMRDVSDLDVQLWHLVAGGTVGTSMVSIWSPTVAAVTDLLDDLRGDRVFRDLRDEAASMLHGPERDSVERVLGGTVRQLRSRPGWLQVRHDAAAARRPGSWVTDNVEAGADIGFDMVAVNEVYGDERRIAWIRTAHSHTALIEVDDRLAADPAWAASDAAVERHLTPAGRTVTLWRRSV